MLEELYYYFVLPFTTFAGVCGFLYVMDPDGAKRTALSLSWNFSKACVTAQDWRDNFSSYFAKEEDGDSGNESDISSEEEEEAKRTLVFYDAKSGNNYISDNNDEALIKVMDKIDPTIIFEKLKRDDLMCFKRIKKNELEDWSKREITEIELFKTDPFIQVEYKFGEGTETLDIHSNLKGFYMNGNTILDKQFLEWYLARFYNRALDPNYELHIFDKDVNLLKIGPEQLIELKDNEYIITPVVEDVYEGASEE